MVCATQVHYTARFADGIVFDSSYKRGRSLTMRIGVGKVQNLFFILKYLVTVFAMLLYMRVYCVQVIKGLDQGILGGEGVPPMRIGINLIIRS